MIYLLGGSSHVGKTYFAQKLMEKLRIPYVSIDHIKMGMIRSGLTNLTPEDDYEMRYWLWPFLSEMIKTAIENNQSMILEGCYFPHNWKDSFNDEYMKDIRNAFIVMSEKYIRNNFKNIVDYANVIEMRLCDEPDMERLIKCSQMFKEECTNNKSNYIEIDDVFDEKDIMSRLLKIAAE